MTDSLRDRIAAALRERVACGHHETYEDVADAVIEALALTKEDEYNPYDPFPPPYRVRYVTEWTTDE